MLSWLICQATAHPILPKWSAEQSTSLLIGAMNRLQQQQPEMFGRGVCYYGHSIGGFHRIAYQ